MQSTDALLYSHFLEFMNAAWLMLCVCVMLVFGRYIWIERAHGYWQLKPAIAVAVYVAGEGVVRAWIWMLRYAHAHPGAGMPLGFPGLQLGAAVAAVGLLCILRIFSPAGLGNAAWFAAALLATAFGLISAVLGA